MPSTNMHPAGRSTHGVLGRLLRRHPKVAQASAAAADQQGEEPITPIADAPMRRPVRLAGMVRVVTVNPRGGNRWLEAVLDDGTGDVTLIWMGRRLLRGIDAGRHLEVEGVVTLFEGRPTLYNPKYKLLAP